MFISLQMPFTDLRPFINEAPERLERLSFEPLETFTRAYVRSFGKIKGRGYIPEFETQYKTKRPFAVFCEHWEDIPNLWSDEYFYAWTRNGLRFSSLEKHQLIDGKLIRPRVKVRALHYSPYKPSEIQYSPVLRVEIGIHYDVTEPLTGEELEEALRRFLVIPAKIPKYEDRSCDDGYINKKKTFIEAPLIEQFDAISNLFIVATTGQNEIKGHPRMVPSGSPILTVHFFPDELKDDEQPSNTAWLPEKLTSKSRIGYFPLKACDSLYGSWLFELPPGSKKSLLVKEKRETIRNYTIAVMRYWSELQGLLASIRLLQDKQFGNAVEIEKDSKLKHYINKASHFLLQSRWHRANLKIIRNIANAHECKIIKPLKRIVLNGEEMLNRQIAEKTEIILSEIGRPAAFLSYSHKDNHWQKVIQDVLAPLHKTGQIKYFDDSCIDAGTSWQKVIIDAIGNANIAILLLSNDFLKSDFIIKTELPKIIYALKMCKLKRVIPVEVTQVDKDLLSKYPFLKRIQFFNRNKPLCSMSRGELDFTINNLKQGIKDFL